MHSRALTRGESQHRPVNEEKQKELRDRPSNNLYVQDHSQSMIPSRPMQTYDSIQPGYYLPSYIEDGDPMENDSKLKSSFTSAVGYNGYGRVPVALYLNPSNFAGHQVTEPTTPLTPSYDSQCDWWDDVPNKEVSVLRQLRLTTSEFTPTKTEYDTYILHRNKQYATTKELPGASSSHAERGDGMVAAPVSANVRDTYALATPSRQTFGGLPVMNPSRNWNTHSPSRIRAVSSRSNLGTSQTSQLGSIPETQHSPTRGLGDSFRVSPLFERRGAGLPYVMADRFVSHQTLRRSVSEVLQRHVMPQSPYLYRVVEPAIPFTTNEPGENSQQHNPLQDCPEESFPPTSENLRLFVSHASAFSTGKRAVLTMPSGFPCAGFPVFSLGTAPALGTRHDGQPISGLPIAALDLCQASGTGCTRSLCFAVKVNPLYSVAKESGSCQILHSATLNFLGNQYPYADVEESRPSSHVEIKNTEPLTLFKGSLEELRLMYSTELRCMMSQQIRSGSRETPSDASNSKSGSTKRASSPVQLPVFIEASRSYGMSTLSIAASRKVGNQKEIHQSQQRLSPNFKQQLESSKRLSEIAIPNHPHSILKSNLPPHGAGRQQMIKDDPSLKVLAEEGLVPVSPFIGASEVVSAPTHELAPTWVQSEHPRSWRSRLAMGESITPFTANAFNLLTSLDPAKYCLPYGSTVFGIKSNNEANVRSSIQYGVWCSTGMGNNSLQRAWNLRGHEGHKIILVFSINSSQKYCGMAEMTGPVNPDARPKIWTEGHYRGAFPVRWIVCKNVPFCLFQDMRNAQNNHLPVTTHRDATALPEALGRELIRTYIEAPHYENILLAAAQGGFGPATGRSGRSSEVSYAPNTHSIVYRAGYLPLEVPIPTNSPRAISQNRRSLQYDFTPRVVDGANFAYPQAVQTNPATSWRLQGRRPKDGGGRIPGATNHTYHSGRIVGATNRTRSPGLQPSQGPSSTNSTTNRASQVYQAFHLEGTEPVDSEADHNHAHPIDENDNDLFYNPAVDS